MRIWIAAENGDCDNHCNKSDGKNNKVITDFQNGALEVANGVRLLDQLCCLAEIGVRAGGIDQRADLSLANDRTGEYGFARFARRRKRLSRQRGLIHFHRIAVQQARVRRHDVSQTQPDCVTWHQLACCRVDPVPVTDDARLGRQLGLQGSDGVAGLALFPEPNHAICKQQKQDDEEIWPVLDNT